MAIKQTWTCSNGRTFDKQSDAEACESELTIRNRINELIIQTVPYVDGKDTVQTFIEDNFDKLRAIFAGEVKLKIPRKVSKKELAEPAAIA